jgi:hypothetical protein
VKPLTESRACALLDTLPKAEVGRATVFVSHAWRYVFEDVVSAIEMADTSSPPEEARYWFDLVNNSQHGTAERPFEVRGLPARCRSPSARVRVHASQ